MRLIVLGFFIATLIYSAILNVAFMQGRITPEQEFLAMDCSTASDPIGCVTERNNQLAGR